MSLKAPWYVLLWRPANEPGVLASVGVLYTLTEAIQWRTGHEDDCRIWETTRIFAADLMNPDGTPKRWREDRLPKGRFV